MTSPKPGSLLVIASALGLAATPAAALELGEAGGAFETYEISQSGSADTMQHSRKRGYRDSYRTGYRDGYRGSYRDDYYRGDRVYRDTRVWRGRDGRYYCRKDDGTTGLLIGAAVGGLIGNEVAGRGDKTLGTLLGAVGGALLGREIDRSDMRCR